MIVEGRKALDQDDILPEGPGSCAVVVWGDKENEEQRAELMEIMAAMQVSLLKRAG